MHTPLCKHADGDPEEYADVAEYRGLKGIVVTCHNPTEIEWGWRVRMAYEEFNEYVGLVARATKAYAGRVDVRLGIESDYAPGMERWLEKLHKEAEFHHVLGSVHPQLPEYRALYLKNNDAIAFQRTYFDHLAMAAESGCFDTLSHPDLVKNCFPSRWNIDLVMDSIEAALDRIKKAGTAMELNTSGLNKDIQEMNPGPKILAAMQKRGIPVVIGADAHRPGRVADNYEMAMDMLKGIGFTHVSYFINRKRHDVPIDAARASLKNA
jgi:histidinol-phosphatase (PHP family)